MAITSTDIAPSRVLAIDWSGRASGAQKTIWLAETRAGQLVRLENGRRRDAVAAHLIAEAARDPQLIVGLDFAFSFPDWFLRERALPDAPALWALAAREGERWLRECAPPFWGRPGKGRPPLPAWDDQYRRTDLAIGTTGGIRPKPIFQIGGAGAVGTGSIRGLPILARLRAAGFAIWPFDPPGRPLALEIYPRSLTGPVVKSSAAARAAYLSQHHPALATPFLTAAAGSEDAFDAAVSALAMARHVADLAALPPLADATLRREGIIWHPGWREQLDLGAAGG